MNIQGKLETVYSPQKILLLDDNRDLLQIVQIILKGQGYETVLASSIEEALLKIKIHKPVLILMDVCLSEGDGYSFCNRLKNDPETSNVRVIMMSGYTDGDHSPNGTENDPDGFLEKPFTTKQFDEIVDTVLGTT